MCPSLGNTTRVAEAHTSYVDPDDRQRNSSASAALAGTQHETASGRHRRPSLGRAFDVDPHV
eukprot:2004572-Alexandrium_andersonii.AAC.1